MAKQVYSVEHLKQIFIELAHENYKTNPHMPIQIPLSYGAQWLKEYCLPDRSIDEIQALINHCSKIDAKEKETYDITGLEISESNSST